GPADQHDHDGSTAVLNPPSDEMGFADETATAGHDERPSTEDLLDEISRLDSFLRALNDEHARRLSELEGEVQELRRRVSTLERDRLGAAPDRVGGSTVLHDEYRSIGQNVEGILTQYVLYLAEPSGAGRRRGQSDSLRAARAAREICEPLFAPGNADRQAFLAAVQAVVAPRDRERLDLAATVADEVSRLRQQADANGLPHVWSFEARLGHPVDDALQRVHGSCDPAGPVELVVFPAFLVEGEVV